MNAVALPAPHRGFSPPPAACRSSKAMSSRPPQTLSSPRAHTRRSRPRLKKSRLCRLSTITPAAFHPRRHMADPSAILKSP